MECRLRARVTAIAIAFGLVTGIGQAWGAQVNAQSVKQHVELPTFEVDPYWPKPLPDRWITGESGGVCIDAHDHVFIINRGDLSPAEQKTSTASPPIIEFDPAGNVINSWGNRDALPKGLHSCTIDFENNIWIGGNQDGIVQKYTHDGSKMLLQIGTRGLLDTSDGMISGPQ
jgi:hypothetical protein